MSHENDLLCVKLVAAETRIAQLEQTTADTYTGYTPGPWQWFGNTQSKLFYLATPDRGRQFVMTFCRYGIQGAQPAFQVNGLMHKASELCRYEVGDSGVIGAEQARTNSTVYRKDVSGIDNPDARLIADAWRIPLLLARIAQLESALSDLVEAQNGPPLIRDAKAWQAAMDAAQAALGTQERCNAIDAMQTGRGPDNVPDEEDAE